MSSHLLALCLKLWNVLPFPLLEVNSYFSIILQPELLSFKQKKDHFRYFPWSKIIRAALCCLHQAQVSEPLKGTLKWTTQKHYTHTHPCYRYSAPRQQAQRRNLPRNSLHIVSGFAVLSMDQQSMTSVIQVLTLLTPRVSSSVLALHLWGAHRSHLLQHVSSAWAPLVHSFSQLIWNRCQHLILVFIFLVCMYLFFFHYSVFMRGSLVILKGIFCVCRALWYFLEKLVFLNLSDSELGSHFQMPLLLLPQPVKTCRKWLKMVFFLFSLHEPHAFS